MLIKEHTVVVVWMALIIATAILRIGNSQPIYVGKGWITNWQLLYLFLILFSAFFTKGGDEKEKVQVAVQRW